MVEEIVGRPGKTSQAVNIFSLVPVRDRFRAEGAEGLRRDGSRHVSHLPVDGVGDRRPAPLPSPHLRVFLHFLATRVNMSNMEDEDEKSECCQPFPLSVPVTSVEHPL